jgi:hypothetical protein
MSWMEKRAQFDERNNQLAQKNTMALITKLKQSISNYVEKTGNERNVAYQAVVDQIKELNNIKNQYFKLNEDIMLYLENESKDPSLSDLLRDNGEIQRLIQRLTKIGEEINVDVESALARDELLRSRNSTINSHTLYLLDRPVRRGSISYLWVLSILFIGVGILFFYQLSPSFSISSSSYNQPISILTHIIDFFTNTKVLGSLLIAALIVILFLSLKIGGIFGK